MPPKKPPIRSPDFLPIVPNVFPVIIFPIFSPPTVAWLRNSPALCPRAPMILPVANEKAPLIAPTVVSMAN